MTGTKAIGSSAGPTTAETTIVGPGKTSIELTLNGKATKIETEPWQTLLDTLRNDVGLTGAKRVCDRGACGACTVIVDGLAVNSCSMLAVDVMGKTVTTVEGLATGDQLTPIQEAFVECAAVYRHIPDYFPNDVGVVGGMVGVLGGLGGFFCPIIFGYLLQETGLWTTSWMFFFVLSLACLVWMMVVVRRLTKKEAPELVRQIETEEFGALGEK